MYKAVPVIDQEGDSCSTTSETCSAHSLVDSDSLPDSGNIDGTEQTYYTTTTSTTIAVMGAIRRNVPCLDKEDDADVEAPVVKNNENDAASLPAFSISDYKAIESGYPCFPRQMQTIMNSRSLKFGFAAAGIVLSYLVHGNFTEDVFSYESPEDGAKFRYAWLLQLMESVCNVIVGIMVRIAFGGEKDLPLKTFAIIGSSQLFAKTFTSLSLAAGLSFPVCTLSKSAKMVPVMIGQILLGGSRYTWADYSVAAAIVSGTMMLIMSSGDSKKKSASDTTILGLLFIMVALFMDGVTGGLQKGMKKKMKLEGKSLRTNDMLLYSNVAMATLAFVISMATDDWYLGWDYFAKNPPVLRMALITCVCSVVGQTFIFFMVTHFDPLACATVTTSRKIMSVIWSISAKGNSLSFQGAFGVALAIFGLAMETRNNLSSTSKRIEN